RQAEEGVRRGPRLPRRAERADSARLARGTPRAPDPDSRSGRTLGARRARQGPARQGDGAPRSGARQASPRRWREGGRDAHAEGERRAGRRPTMLLHSEYTRSPVRRAIACAVLALGLTAACEKKDEPAPTPPATAEQTHTAPARPAEEQKVSLGALSPDLP